MRPALWFVVGFLAFALPLRAADSQPAWVQVDDDDGIKTWKLEVPGQEFPSFRGQTTIEASIATIRAVIEDVARHPEWMQNCVDAKLIKRIGDDRAIVYNRTGTPWPVWDRDVVLDTQFSSSEDGKVLTLTFRNTDPQLHPLPEKTVRMPRLLGSYIMRELSPEKTLVTYQVEADVAGSIPRWLADRLAKDMPYKTLSRLRERTTTKR
jgi:hypothetical protein